MPRDTPAAPTPVDVNPTITRADLDRPHIAVRAPLPDRALAYIETTGHPRRGSCLVVRYHREDEEALIATLQETINAIRRGPTDD
jgi:hypothetical protein